MEVVGGTNVSECQQGLNNNPQIIIGTPGRVLDMIQKRYLFTSNIHTLIFDEADETLSYGFKLTIYNIIKIPNLEIYKIDNSNGLKYLRATKPFQVGVRNDNVTCFNSDIKKSYL